MVIEDTIEARVRQFAETKPSKTAVICGEEVLTYSELWDRVGQKATALKNNGVKEGSLYIFRSSQSPDFLITYMAVHIIGAVAVPLERDCPEDTIKLIKESYGHKHLPQAEEPLENIADVLFTTGSTGKQKGVMESYRAINANSDNLIKAQGFTKDTVFIICGPLNHIGSLSKIWPTLMLGGTLIILQGMKDINALFDAFHYSSNHIATFMVPASIRIAIQLGTERLQEVANKIEFMETGGAAISQTDIDTLRKLLPTTRLYNTYASTETGIVCTNDFNHDNPVMGCVGRPMPHSKVFITPEHTIACKGDTLMSGYLDDEALTAEVLHDGTVFTTDLGEIDTDGCLHIKGRDNDVINIGGYKVAPLEVENIANAFPAIAESICCLTHSPIFGDTIKLVYSPKDWEKISKKELARFMAGQLEGYKLPRVFQQVPFLRHSYNGKLDRKSYR